MVLVNLILDAICCRKSLTTLLVSTWNCIWVNWAFPVFWPQFGEPTNGVCFGLEISAELSLTLSFMLVVLSSCCRLKLFLCLLSQTNNACINTWKQYFSLSPVLCLNQIFPFKACFIIDWLSYLQGEAQSANLKVPNLLKNYCTAGQCLNSSNKANDRKACPLTSKHITDPQRFKIAFIFSSIVQ